MKETSVINAAYSVGGNIAKIIVAIGGVVVLGRVLGPEIYGDYAIVSAIHIVLLPVLDIGLGPAYYKEEFLNQQTRNAYFTAQVFLAATAFLLVTISAYPTALLYDNMNLLYLLVVHGLTMLIIGLGLQPMNDITILNRYKILVVLQTVSAVFGTILAIVFAVLGFGVWSLSIKLLSTSLILTLAYFFFSNQKYSLVVFKNLKPFKKSFKFSFDLGLSRAVSGIAMGLDNMIIGYYFNSTVLGNYDRAYMLSMYPDSAVRAGITRPILTYIAKHSDPNLLYPFIAKILISISGFFSIYISFFSEEIVGFLLGQEWIGAGRFLRFLSLVGLAYIFRGVYNTIQINEMQGRDLFKKGVASLGFIYAPSILALAYYKDPFAFVYTFTGAWLLFWTALLLYRFFIQLGKEVTKDFGRFLLGFFLCAVLSIYSSKLLAGYVDSTLLKLTLGLVVSVVQFFILMLILLNLFTKEVINFIRRRV